MTVTKAQWPGGWETEVKKKKVKRKYFTNSKDLHEDSKLLLFWRMPTILTVLPFLQVLWTLPTEN